MNKLSRKHYTDKASVNLWMQFLAQEKNYLTYFKLNTLPGPFLVSWMSPWQVKLLKNAQEWCLDSTHKTCTSFNNNNDDAYLFTIVVRSDITNKGVPVCFFITDAEKQTVLVEWLKWIITVVGDLSVKKIMIDCSATEISALKEVFQNNVSILLCHWHIKRAWEKKNQN